LRNCWSWRLFKENFMELLKKTIRAIRGLDLDAVDKARSRLDSLLKPPGSLGRLEDISRQLAGITGVPGRQIMKKVIIVMCADNGVAEEGVSSYPSDVTTLVADTMARGISGVSVLSRHAGAELIVVDVGLKGDISGSRVLERKISRGTMNIFRGPAMSRDQAVRAVETGIAITTAAVNEGADLIGTGEIGIGNTTTASAILHVLTGVGLDEVVGRGAGLSDEGLMHKKSVIRKAVELNRPDPDDALDVLAKVGGFDIAGLAGCYLAAAACRVPIVVDGFIAGAAAVAAARLNPGARDFMFSSHASAEPGAAVISSALNLFPVLALEMRLGEGTGCALAFHIIEAAVKITNEMGTFKDIGM
jgi:nicotinate-nucleotide--dimethylbenzimidazole phosphoribosyltransferase